MEKFFTVPDTHTRSISSVGFNPFRREVMIGCEDGVVKTYEADTGRLVHTYNEHTGFVTEFCLW